MFSAFIVKCLFLSPRYKPTTEYAPTNVCFGPRQKVSAKAQPVVRQELYSGDYSAMRQIDATHAGYY
ncbi:uncharacterized protein PG998_012365 [Apiospora kogelbergensis]|uniref:Uncharacterized protein n=1 Tax=Apiospora kogelbergensis TaxID=1337665 RepID=A0AAW0QUH5_9PEZI